jgi:hypothetical protein
MTFPDYEHSYIWGGKTLGDAHQAPYPGMWFMFYLKTMARYSMSERKYGVLSNTHASYSGNLAPTNPVGNTVRIASGAAINWGFIYLSDDNEDFDCTNQGHYRVVLRAIYSQKTVRLVLLGPAPANYPAAVHTNDINDISIALVGSSTGIGVTAVYDRRRFFRNLSIPVHSGETYYWYIPSGVRRVRGVTIQCGSVVPEKVNDPPGASYGPPRPYPATTAPIVMLQAAGGATAPGASNLVNRTAMNDEIDYYLGDVSNLTAIWWLSFGMSR